MFKALVLAVHRWHFIHGIICLGQMNSIAHPSWPAMSGRQLWEVGPGKCKMGCSRAVAIGTATEVDGCWCRLGIAKHSRCVKTDSWKERVQIPGYIVKGDGQFFACLPLQCCDARMAQLLRLLSYDKHTVYLSRRSSPTVTGKGLLWGHGDTIRGATTSTQGISVDT